MSHKKAEQADWKRATEVELEFRSGASERGWDRYRQ